MNPTVERDRISKLAASDWRKAAELASGIPDPWFRCQALSKAALLAPDKNHQLQLIHKAFESGAECSEPNRIVTVSTWPVKALFILGYLDEGENAAMSLLEVIQSEASPVRRADALNYLLGSIVASSMKTFWTVFDAFLTACTTKLESGKKNSKGESLLATWAGPISLLDIRRGESLLAAIEGPNHRKQAVQSRERAKNRCISELVSWPNV